MVEPKHFLTGLTNCFVKKWKENWRRNSIWKKRLKTLIQCAQPYYKILLLFVTCMSKLGQIVKSLLIRIDCIKMVKIIIPLNDLTICNFDQLSSLVILLMPFWVLTQLKNGVLALLSLVKFYLPTCQCISYVWMSSQLSLARFEFFLFIYLVLFYGNM